MINIFYYIQKNKNYTEIDSYWEVCSFVMFRMKANISCNSLLSTNPLITKTNTPTVMIQLIATSYGFHNLSVNLIIF